MKKTIYLAFTLVMILAMTIPATAGTGNDAPSGPHYNLNIIGVPKNKTADMTGDNGHRIFVPLDRVGKILLAEGDEFQVLDANGTDGNGAKFQLPNPDPDLDGVTVYSVYARALGKPNGQANMSTCVTDLADPTITFCSAGKLFVRDKGQQKFENVSKELLYVSADIDADGTIETFPLFSDAAYEYFWQYDNNGLKLAQLRFYEIPTDTNG